MKPNDITIVNLHLRSLAQVTGKNMQDILSLAINNLYRDTISNLSPEEMEEFSTWFKDTCYDIDFEPVVDLLESVNAELAPEFPRPPDRWIEEN